jgi:hypothetical protein
MSIQYSIISNPIPGQEGKYMTRVARGRRVPAEEIAQQVSQRMGWTTAQVLATLTVLEEVVSESLRRGEIPEIGNICYLTPSLTATFDNPNATVTKSNSEFQISPIAHRTFARQIKDQVTYEKVSGLLKMPLISTVFDVTSGLSNVFTPGGMITIRGEDLDFNPDSGSEGVRISYYDNNGQQVIMRPLGYNRTGNKLVEFSWPQTSQNQSQLARTMLPNGFTLTLETTYGAKSGAIHRAEYEKPLMRAPILGESVTLKDYSGTGSEGMGAINALFTQGTLTLKYQAHGDSAYGATVTIQADQDYTLTSDTVTKTLMVGVRKDKLQAYLSNWGEPIDTQFVLVQ